MRIVESVKNWRLLFQSMPLLTFHDARVEKNFHHHVMTHQSTSPVSLSRATFRTPIAQASPSIYRLPIPTPPHLQLTCPPNWSANASHTPTFHPNPPSTILILLYRLLLQSLSNVHASLIPLFPVSASNLKTNRSLRNPAPKAL